MYMQFQTQPYLQSSQFSLEEIAMLYNMRADTVNGYKKCFPSIYRNDLVCKFLCQEEDSISHAFSCPQLKVVQENTHIQYEDIFSGVQQQKRAVKKFIQLNTTRSALLKADPAYQGLVLDTATPAPAGGARV